MYTVFASHCCTESSGFTGSGVGVGSGVGSGVGYGAGVGDGSSPITSQASEPYMPLGLYTAIWHHPEAGQTLHLYVLPPSVTWEPATYDFRFAVDHASVALAIENDPIPIKAQTIVGVSLSLFFIMEFSLYKY